MGRKSVRKNKTIYQIYREDLELTREKASDLMKLMSPERIEKIESGKSPVHPEEIPLMAKCYKRPELINYYCSNECPIGRKEVAPVEQKDLSQIVLEVLASLNTLNKDKEKFIEISADGKISENEREAFDQIKNNLEAISSSLDSLKLWMSKVELGEND